MLHVNWTWTARKNLQFAMSNGPNRQTRCRRGILLSDHKTPRSGHDAFDMFTIASTPLMSFATCRAEIVGHALQVRQGKLASSSRANW